MVKPNSELKPQASTGADLLAGVRKRVLKAPKVSLSEEHRALVYPGMACEPRLTLKKENGVVMGFKYRCSCGHTDHFICQ